MSEIEHKPGLYRRMCEPFENYEEANAAWSAFYEGVRELREKHRIKDLYFVAEIAIVHDDESERQAMMSAHVGDSTRRLLLAAYGYHESQAAHEDMLVQVGKQAKLHARKAK